MIEMLPQHSIPICQDCKIEIDLPSFRCPYCDEMPNTKDLEPFLSYYLKNLPFVEGFRICVYTPFLSEKYSNTPALPVILYHLYETCFVENKIVYENENFRKSLFEKIPFIRSDYYCRKFPPVMKIVHEFEKTFSTVNVNNYKNDIRNQ